MEKKTSEPRSLLDIRIGRLHLSVRLSPGTRPASPASRQAAILSVNPSLPAAGELYRQP